MSIRFVIGRAGTGKTALCAREIREESARRPIGGALLWIVPEQATFAAERMLLTGSGAGGGGAGGGAGGGVVGSFRAQVLSFRRLALLIARETGLITSAGSNAGKPLDEVARLVLLEETVRRHRDQLTVFGAVADRPGFIKKLDGTLRELRQHGHSGASVRAIVEGNADGSRLDAATARKLLDLALLLEAWSLEVDGDKQESLDFEHVMHEAALKAGVAPLITGRRVGEPAQVWVDAFSAMTALEIRMLAGLGLHAGETTITLLADPDAEAMQTLRPGVEREQEQGGGVFSRTERLHRRLIDAFRRYQVPIGETFFLRAAHRFANPDIRRIESDLFADGPVNSVDRSATLALPAPAAPHAVESPVSHTPPTPSRKKGQRRTAAQPSLFDFMESPSTGASAAPMSVPTPQPQLLKPHTPAGVELWECSDPETEVRIAAQAIRELVLGEEGIAPGLRYRQIAVITPDLETYADALRRVFTEHRIPHFIDQRRSIAHHPLVELLRSAVAIATARWDRDDVLLFLKTHLTGISAADVALVENYIIEHGITHIPWAAPWTWIAPNEREEEASDRIPQSARVRLRRVNEIREQTHAILQPFIAQCTGQANPASAAHFPGALRALLASLNIETRISEWIAAARAANDPELAQVHEQVLRQIEQLLALLEQVLATRTRTLEEFERILGTALESLSLGLIPPTVDQVLVSSVTRSRVPEMEAVFILGAVEGQFPKVVEEDPILSDAQREAFNARAADPIIEGAGRQLLEMPLFDYVALTRARRLLVVSCPIASREGKALGRSRYLQRIRDLLGDAVEERAFDAGSRTELNRISTDDDLLAGVAKWARERMQSETRGDVDAPLDAANPMRDVYNWLVRDPSERLRRARERVWAAIAPPPEMQLALDLAQRFYPPERPLRMSASQLERFATCPLQYFMHYTLGLQLRREFALDQLGLGALQHRVLEQVYRKIIDGAFDWPLCDAATLRKAVEVEVDRAIEELHGELAVRTPGYDKTRARVKRTLGAALEADRRRAGRGYLRPASVELDFGYARDPVRDESGRVVSLPVLTIPTPDEHLVQISGKIDRIDANNTGTEEVSVIDYKSGRTRILDLNEIFHGLTLQLPVYALVMRAVGQSRPVAALYFGLNRPPERVTKPDDQPPADSDAFYQQFQLRGVADAAFAGLLDADLSPKEGKKLSARSDWYKMSFNEDGSPGKTSDLLSSGDFQLLLAYTMWKIADMADSLMQGHIAPLPFRQRHRSPCPDCDFASLCPFDRALGTYHDIPRQSKVDVLAAMRAKAGF